MSKTTLTRQQVVGLRGTRWTAAEARAVLAEQESSGESIAGFARRHGLLAQRLSWWRSRLGEWREGAGAGEKLLVPAVVRTSAASVRLRLGELQIEVADAGAVPPGWLAELVRELGARR